MRTQDVCAEQRTVDVLLDFHVTECERRATAHCYRVQDPIERSDLYLCQDTLEQCVIHRGNDVLDSPARIVFGQCKAYD